MHLLRRYPFQLLLRAVRGTTLGPAELRPSTDPQIYCSVHARPLTSISLECRYFLTVSKTVLIIFSWRRRLVNGFVFFTFVLPIYKFFTRSCKIDCFACFLRTIIQRIIALKMISEQGLSQWPTDRIGSTAARHGFPAEPVPRLRISPLVLSFQMLGHRSA